jgi:hypothetical protein
MLNLMAKLAQETSTGSLGSWLTITILAQVKALRALLVVSDEVPDERVAWILVLTPSRQAFIASHSAVKVASPAAISSAPSSVTSSAPPS